MIDVIDRIPSKPNRKKITPEGGTSYYATVEYADEPTEAGTPINRALFQKISAITTGTYVGTGTQGSTNANTLTFDFVPKFVYIIGRGGYKYSGQERNVQTLLVNGSTNASAFGFAAILAPATSGSTYQAGLTVSWNDTGKSVSWYVNNGKDDDISKTMQLNFSSVTYHYIAVG